MASYYTGSNELQGTWHPITRGLMSYRGTWHPITRGLMSYSQGDMASYYTGSNELQDAMGHGILLHGV